MKTKKAGKSKLFYGGIIILVLIVSGLLYAGSRLVGAFFFADRGKVAEYPESLEKLACINPEAASFADNNGLTSKKKTVKEQTDQMNADRSIPLYIQWDERWGYRKYGGDYMAVTGCGPTCISMVKSGLSGNKKWNPYKVAKKAEKNGYYVEGQGTSWELMTNGAEMFGLYSYDVIFDQQHIIEELEAGKPIICTMRPGEFTTTGHFIVLIGVTEDGLIQLNDPNSIERSAKLWDIETLMPQIRNLWAFDLAENI